MICVVVGAGIGGLAAAVELAAFGVDVDVVEASSEAGGKAGRSVVAGVAFDTGPSVLTLVDVLDRVFRAAGTSLADEVQLVRASPVFHYRWPDGTLLPVHFDPVETEASVRDVLGPDAAQDFASFLSYAKDIWDAASPAFVMAPAPSLSSLVGFGVMSLASSVSRIDPLRTMGGAIDRRVRSRHLRDLFARYATYNGSDPRSAPATLNCIAHVELGLGCYGVRGGMYELVRALERVAVRLGVRFHYDSPVEAVLVRDRVARGVVVGGREVQAGTVVVNADVRHLVDDLLDRSAPTGLSSRTAPSLSGWTAVVAASADAERVAHTVLFPERYHEEFRDLFDRGVAPGEPTIYLCDQHLAHERGGWPDGRNPLFVMANAPPTTVGPDDDDAHALREVVLGRLRRSGLISAGDEIVWERSPRGLARRFPGTHGALYGLASNSRLAAFRRPPNRISSIGGLYLASGSAHPGGGVPLCAQSGLLAAQAALFDLGICEGGLDNTYSKAIH